MINKTTVLLIDDDKETQDLLDSLLSPDYQLITVSDSDEALASISELKPSELSLILIDAMSPEAGGYQLLPLLREDSRAETTPILFFTNTTIPEHYFDKKEFRLGVIDYIAKPFHVETLKQRVRNYIYLKNIEDELQEAVTADEEDGLYNHQQFAARLNEEWKRGRRSYSEVTLLLITVDNFKHYKEHYGEAEGALCLSQITSQVQLSFMRVTDFPGHYGREQFAVLLYGATLEQGVKTASAFLESVRALEIPHAKPGSSDHITASIGVASMVPNTASTAKDLINHATQELSKAELEGGDCAFPSFMDSITEINSAHKIEWKEQFSVNHPIINEQHKMLLSSINQMVDDLSTPNKADISGFQKNISVFEALFNAHLEYEESVLSQQGYPDIEKHCSMHKAYKERVLELTKSEPSIPHYQHLTVVLREWFQNHVLNEDMLYKPYM